MMRRSKPIFYAMLGRLTLPPASPSKISNIITSCLKITDACGRACPTDGSDSSCKRNALSERTVYARKERDCEKSLSPFDIIPDATPPAVWLRFLDELLYAEDIPCLQEYIGYCLIPSNKGQRMMLIKAAAEKEKARLGRCFRTCSDAM